MFHDLIATQVAGGWTSLQSAVKLRSWKLLQLNQSFSIIIIIVFLQHYSFLIATTCNVPTCSLPAQMSGLYATNLVSS